jgi:hypothetical protein
MRFTPSFVKLGYIFQKLKFGDIEIESGHLIKLVVYLKKGIWRGGNINTPLSKQSALERKMKLEMSWEIMV